MSRLPPIYPPFRYGVVEEDLFRGAYPKERNFRFLRRLRLKAILSLTPDPPNPALSAFCTENNITPIHIRVDKPKEHIPLSFQKTAQILAVLTDTANHPLFVHCLDGTGVTGAVILCLRKLQCWTMASILVESTRYHKEGVIGSEEAEFVEKFNAEIELPPRIPKWLWGGHISFKKHPTVRLKLPPQNAMGTTKAVASTALDTAGVVTGEGGAGGGAVQEKTSLGILSATTAVTAPLDLSSTSFSNAQRRISRHFLDKDAHSIMFPPPVSAGASPALAHALSVPKDIGAPYLNTSKNDLRREKEELRRRAVTEELLGREVAARTCDELGVPSAVHRADEIEDEDVEDDMSMTLQALALEMSGPLNKQ